jgi:hypothetical protein
MKKNLLVSVSGGRTSMFMAVWIWANWRHKYNIIFVFANTGAEHELTLKFVDYCAYIFNMQIVWVEALVSSKHGESTRHTVVTYNTASRNYEPFNAVVDKYGIANQSYPHCNRELKLAPIHSYASEVFGGTPYKNYETAIGIRVDEVDRMHARHEELKFIYPLISTIPTKKAEILKFWSEQVYDLEIPEHYGNCKVCHKKSDRKLATIALEQPHWFDQAKQWEATKSFIKVKDGNEPRKIYRGHKTVNDIFAIAKDEHFEIFADGNFSGPIHDLDVESPCSLDCGVYA